MTARHELQVIDLETDEVVRTIDVSGHSERQVERIERGLLRNMNRDRYVVDEVRRARPSVVLAKL